MLIMSNTKIIELLRKNRESLIQDENFISIDIIKTISQISSDKISCIDDGEECNFINTHYNTKCNLFDTFLKRGFPTMKCPDCMIISKEVYPELYI